MAQSISLISGSPLIGNPIVYQVTPEAYNQDYTFHRIIVRVYAKLETDDDYTTFDFSTPVETKPNGLSYSTQPSRFDISSALQAVADKYEYTPETPERYPYIKFRIETWDEWMENGVVSPEQGVAKWPENTNTDYEFYAYAFMGAFNDLERLGTFTDQSGVEYLNITYLSRKPNTSPEIVFKDVPFIYPSAFDSLGRSIGDTDYMSDDASPTFISGAPDHERNATPAYRYDNIPGQSTAMAGDGDIVLLVYNDIETDYALKVCHVEQASTNPVTGQTTLGSITWTSQKANVGDAYAVDGGRTYVATPTGWELSSTIGPKSLRNTPSAVGSATVGGHDIYAINKPTNGYEMRFVNGMGCLESVCVTSFVKKQANIHTEKHTVSKRETLKKFSRMLTVKTSNKDVWTLCSGPLDEDWTSWYVHEFLMAQWMWIKVGSQWIPCHILPEETETIIDEEKAQMMKVQFKIEFDIAY